MEFPNNIIHDNTLDDFNISELNDDELICIFLFLPFRFLVAIAPKVCRKWRQIISGMHDVNSARHVGKIIFHQQYLKILFDTEIKSRIAYDNIITNSDNYTRLSLKLYHEVFNRRKEVYFHDRIEVSNLQLEKYMTLFTRLEKLSFFNQHALTRIPKTPGFKFIKKIRIRECGNITDFSAIEELTNLQEFRIRNNKFKNIDFLKNCLRIKIIKVMNCPNLNDISVITKFKLDYFNVTNCQDIIDVSLFSQCNIKYIYIKESVIRDFSSLGDLPFLEKLIIIDNIFVDSLLCLKDNYQLKYLTIANCPNITDLSFIQENSKLEILQLSKIGTNDLSSIVNCDNLTTLSLEYFNTGEIDVSFFKNLLYLEHVTLISCSIYDLKVLENCIFIQQLGINNCDIKNINFIKVMFKLEFLLIKDLENIVDISVLKNCFNLDDIDIANCPMIDDVSCLRHCANLKVVYISDCPKLYEVVDNLKEELPDVNIYIR